MGTFGVILHNLGLGKGKYQKYEGTFVVEKPFDYLTQKFAKKAISFKGYGSAWKFTGNTRMGDSAYIFNLNMSGSGTPAHEYCFKKIDAKKTEVSIVVYDAQTYDADYLFASKKKFISKL